MSTATPHMATDLTWLTDATTAAVAAYVRHPLSLAKDEPVELVVWKYDLLGPVVRLTHYPRSGLLYINGQLEEREDYLSITALFDQCGEADLPPGEQIGLGGSE